MDRQQIGLKLALSALQQELDLTGFDPRLVLQKSIYLAQAAGVDLGYTFTWYLRGPYSPALTRDAFALRAELSQNSEEWKEWALDPGSVTRLDHLRTLFAAIPAPEFARRLELLASAHFLIRTRQSPADDPRVLGEVLRRNGKDFSESDIRVALQDLRDHDLLTGLRS